MTTAVRALTFVDRTRSAVEPVRVIADASLLSSPPAPPSKRRDVAAPLTRSTPREP